MAVNMNKRAQWRMTYVAFLLLISIWGSESSTTISPTNATEGNVTDATTTTPAPTTTTTVTTTTIAPPSAIDSNSLLGQCPCDLTGNACDVNCCCDEDCTEDDKKAFSQCLPFSYNVDDRLCFRKEIILFENSQPVFSNISDEDLFCIYYDNNEERNFYTNPDQVYTLEAFQDYRSQFLTFTFQSDFVSQFDFTAAFYKSGDPIYTVFESLAVGVLGLPRSLTTTDCVDENPAAYLLDESFTCVRHSLPGGCNTTAGLNANNFFTGFRVVTSPQLFQDFNATLEGTVIDGFYSLYNNSYTIPVELDNGTVPPIQCIYDNGVKGPCDRIYSAPPTPYLDDTGICRDILREVHYRLITDGTTGITRVLASFFIGNFSGSSLTQTFTSTFQSTTTAERDDSFQRSGNPGYVVGQPVLAGTLNQTTDGTNGTILLNGNRDAYMTVVKPSATGDCVSDAPERTSVTFGNNMRTGCFLKIDSSNLTEYCVLLQQAVVNTTEYDSIPQLNAAGTAYVDNNRRVGLYGNTDVSKPGDWVKILYENRPRPSPPAVVSSSCSLSLGMHMQILYANIGALVNPQPKIIGVSFIYHLPSAVQIRCAGGTCQPNNPGGSQGVEITTSVAFIDVSTPATKEQGEPPIFLAKVPYDFFYPFISGGAGKLPDVLSQVLPLIVLIVTADFVWL